jgi:capsid protein
VGFFTWLTTGDWNTPGKIKASSAGYNAASGGRRLAAWNAPTTGPNTISVAQGEQLLRRSRDAIRNSPIASSAIQRFESNIIGTGITPHFKHPDPDTLLFLLAI